MFPYRTPPTNPVSSRRIKLTGNPPNPPILRYSILTIITNTWFLTEDRFILCNFQIHGKDFLRHLRPIPRENPQDYYIKIELKVPILIRSQTKL